MVTSPVALISEMLVVARLLTTVFALSAALPRLASEATLILLAEIDHMPVCPDAPRVSTSTPGWMATALPFTFTVPPAIVAPPLVESLPPTLMCPVSPPSRTMDPRVPSSEFASIRPLLLTTSEETSP